MGDCRVAFSARCSTSSFCACCSASCSAVRGGTGGACETVWLLVTDRGNDAAVGLPGAGAGEAGQECRLDAEAKLRLMSESAERDAGACPADRIKLR